MLRMHDEERTHSLVSAYHRPYTVTEFASGWNIPHETWHRWNMFEMAQSGLYRDLL